MIPDAGGHDAPLARHPRHLPQPRDRVGHEVDDELRQRGVELAGGERQLLGRGTLHVHAGVALARRRDEGLGRIDRGARKPSPDRATSSVVSAPGPQPTSSTR